MARDIIAPPPYLGVEVVLDSRALRREADDCVRPHHFSVRRKANRHPSGKVGVHHRLCFFCVVFATTSSRVRKVFAKAFRFSLFVFDFLTALMGSIKRPERRRSHLNVQVGRKKKTILYYKSLFGMRMVTRRVECLTDRALAMSSQWLIVPGSTITFLGRCSLSHRRTADFGNTESKVTPLPRTIIS